MQSVFGLRGFFGNITGDSGHPELPDLIDGGHILVAAVGEPPADRNPVVGPAGNLQETPGWAGGDRALKVNLCGLRPGQRVRWVFREEEGCGVIRECLTDADTETGPWGMEVLVRVES